MDNNAKNIAELLKMLANENRLLILCALDRQPLTVNQITEKLKNTTNISQSAVSQHLAILRSHDILECEKSGLNVTYRISDNRVVEIIDVLKTYYCQ